MSCCIGGIHVDITWKGWGSLSCPWRMYLCLIILAKSSKSRKSCCLIKKKRIPTPSPTRSLTLTRARCPTRRFRTDVRYGRIWIFFNPQLFLCGFGFRPHVCGVLIRHSNPQLFESALHRVESFEYATIRNRVDAKSGYFYPVWTSQDTMAQFFPWIFQDVAERNVIASFLLGLSVSSLITCVQLNLAMITVHFWLCQTAARHFEASLHVGRTNWTP